MKLHDIIELEIQYEGEAGGGCLFNSIITDSAPNGDVHSDGVQSSETLLLVDGRPLHQAFT
jgi:hypothetical protein